MVALEGSSQPPSPLPALDRSNASIREGPPRALSLALNISPLWAEMEKPSSAVGLSPALDSITSLFSFFFFFLLNCKKTATTTSFHHSEAPTSPEIPQQDGALRSPSPRPLLAAFG